MRRIIEFLIKYPTWGNAFIVATIIVGCINLLSLKRSFFPEIESRIVNVQVLMPGAAPEEVEEGLTAKIEEAVKGIQGIKEVTSTSRENFANVNVEILREFDIDQALADVKNAVDGISSFPTDAEKPIVFKPKSMQLAMRLVLQGDVPLKTLKSYAEDVEDDFMSEPFISQVEIRGLPSREISIEVAENQLLTYELTFDEIAQAVRTNNRDISGGTLKSDREELLIRSNAKEDEPEHIENIVVRTNTDGSILRLGDIADVREQFAEVPNKTLFNGQNGVTIEVNKLAEEDIMKITGYVKKYAAEFNELHPGLKLHVTNDQSIPLNQRINLLLKNGLIGLSLVVLALGLFLSLRLSFWVAVGIPLSFGGMFVVANAAGITINMISLFGMILVIGILVDDGIVIAENIYAHFERGKDRVQAAVDGTLEVLPSVFVSVTTTMLAFSLLFFITGRVGDIVREMAVVVIGSLAFSLIEAVFVLPSHLAAEGSLKPKEKMNRVRLKLNAGIDFMRDRIYSPVLLLCIQYRYIALCLLFIFLQMIVGMRSGGIIESTFFPPISRDNISVSLVLQPGTTENITERILKSVESQIWQVNGELSKDREDGLDVILSTKINIGSGGGESGGHAGTIEIELLDGETRNLNTSVVNQAIRSKTGRIAEAQKFIVGTDFIFGKPVSVNLTGKDAESLEQAKNFLKERLRSIDALKDVTDDDVAGRREVKIKLKPRAHILGLSHDEISGQIRQGFFGEEVQRLQKGSDELRVWVRYPRKGRLNLSQMEDMKIKTAGGEEYPLQELIEYEIERGIVNINRFNNKRQIRVEASMANEEDPVGPVTELVQATLTPELQARFPAVDVSFKGQSERSDEFSSSLTRVAPVFLIAVILLITLVFRSFPQTILILVLIPIGILCAQFGHWIENKPVSILSAWGFIALSGIIINDAVVFLNKYNLLLKEGKSVRDAAFEAGRQRFRPIVLTSITTCAGLYPIVLEKSVQAQFLIPMAISVVYGVLIGTAIILTCFPAMIMAFSDIRRVLNWIRHLLVHGKYSWPSREWVEPAVLEKERLKREGYAD